MTRSPLPTASLAASLAPSRLLGGPWKPLLPEAQRARAREAIQAILDTAPNPEDGRPGPSLSGGHAGLALLWGYAALAERAEQAKAAPSESPLLRRAHQHLERAVDLLASMSQAPWLFSGFTGVAWTVDHFIRVGLLDEDGEDLNEEIDQALMAFLAAEPWPGLPELIAGVSGLGLYGLDRGGRGRGNDIAARAIDILIQKAEQTPHGLAWFDAPEWLSPYSRGLHPEGLFNLGVSHGNPGVMGFLAEAALRGDNRARALLDSSVAWLLSCKDPHEDGSLFGPGFARGGKPNERGMRLSWCYGDLGISAVLLLAARHTRNPGLHAEALGVARACAARPQPQAGLNDAGLCHGAMGNAHLYNRLHQATGEAAFLEQALAFYARGLDMRGETREAGGFLAFSPALPEEPQRDPRMPLAGLLEGSAGIGLALLAATTPVEPLWDRHLLAHVPPQGA